MASNEIGTDDSKRDAMESEKGRNQVETRSAEDKAYMDNKYDFIAGLKTVVHLENNMIELMKAVKGRLDSFEQRLDRMDKSIGDIDTKLGNLVIMTKIIEKGLEKYPE
ncbi:Recyclin-1 [Sesbania bispinosa]|nr:Recyclin-1 [Sesbania bispinosa]